MTDRELFTMVLESLERLNRTGDTQVFDMFDAPVLIPALCARLAQPTKIMGPNLEEVLNAAGFYKQREWVGLTYADLYFWGGELGLGELGKGVLRAVDAHLRKKNNG